MASLKFRNSKGEWESLYALQGPQGSPGPKGDKGDKGDSSGIQDITSDTNGNLVITKSDNSTITIAVGTSGSYLSTTGGTVTGQLKVTNTTASSSTTTGAVIVSGGVGVAGSVRAASVYGAVWNDYAEYREAKEAFAAGYCMSGGDDGKLYKTTQRLQHCEGIVSDTFGFAIGETETCGCPLAVSGRVLAYPLESRKSFHCGDVVCAAEDGKVSKMSREEIKEYPDRIVGVVSEIPSYEKWGTGNVEVNGRIWIKVR